MPFPVCDLKLNGQYTIAKHTRWVVVVIDCNRTKRLGQKVGRSDYTTEQK